MTRDEFLDKQYEISVTAGMNQRYHQRYATWWWRWDTTAKVVTAILAVIGAMIAVACTFEGHDKTIDVWGVVVASAAALMAVVLNVVPFGTWEKEHRDLLSQWTDVREDVEAMLFECPGEPSAYDLGTLKKLDAKIHRLCGDEPSPNTSLIDECYQNETKSRHPSRAA